RHNHRNCLMRKQTGVDRRENTGREAKAGQSKRTGVCRLGDRKGGFSHGGSSWKMGLLKHCPCCQRSPKSRAAAFSSRTTPTREMLWASHRTWRAGVRYINFQVPGQTQKVSTFISI